MKVILKETLDKLNISQYQLSKMTGITAGNINNLCNNKTTRIDFSVLDKICEALNCNITDIIVQDSKDKNYTLQYGATMNESTDKFS